MVQQISSNIEIEHPHLDAPVEWWFFNGCFKGEKTAQYKFMISFFRQSIPKENEEAHNGFSLLFSLFNSESKEYKFVSKIDHTVFSDLISQLDKENNFELDKDLLQVLRKELTHHGTPRPIQLDSAEVIFDKEKIKIRWSDFQLSQTDHRFNINFTNPFSGNLCSIVLEPESPRIELRDSNKSRLLGGIISYSCYPKLKLTGNFDEIPISGMAWMDHQSEEVSSFCEDGPIKKVLGWDWFGINLENGIDLIVIIHKNAKSNERIHLHSAFIDNHEIKYSNNFSAQPIETWESPTTHIVYPVKWEINLVDFGIKLTFSPDTNNQEILILGFARAVWEGSGSVEGTLNGEKIKGIARAEFFGYGYIFDFQNYLQRLADRVDKKIEEFFPKEMNSEQIEKYVGKPYWLHDPPAYTEMLCIPIWDLILRRGKRWRPIFGILMGEALGKSSEHYEASACLAELVHSGALIVDDIEDNSLLRRGEQTLHLKYGTDVALNAGNTLYFLPYVELLTHKYLNEKQKLRIHEIWMKTILEAHFGQTLDIYWSRNMNMSNLTSWMNDSIEEKILQMYDYKTAAGAKGLAEVAAVIAEVDADITKTVISFSRAFAVAFQLIDDTHNFSDSPKWTKTCGEDLYNGKLTYVIVKALRNLDTSSAIRLKEILCTKELREDNNILQAGIELVRSSGALDECRKEAHTLSMKEWEKFAEVVPSCEPKIMLNMLCLKMLDLAYDT